MGSEISIYYIVILPPKPIIQFISLLFRAAKMVGATIRYNMFASLLLISCYLFQSVYYYLSWNKKVFTQEYK